MYVKYTAWSRALLWALGWQMIKQLLVDVVSREDQPPPDTNELIHIMDRPAARNRWWTTNGSIQNEMCQVAPSRSTHTTPQGHGILPWKVHNTMTDLRRNERLKMGLSRDFTVSPYTFQQTPRTKILMPVCFPFSLWHLQWITESTILPCFHGQ